jgi:hypothetical protein
MGHSHLQRAGIDQNGMMLHGEYLTLSEQWRNLARRELPGHVAYDTFCWRVEKMRCPNCNFQNNEASGFCERCGTYLQASYQVTKTYMEDAIPPPPPPPMGYDVTPSYSYSEQSNLNPYQNMVRPRPKINVLRSIFYFLASFIGAFGIYGTMNYLIIVPGSSSAGDVVGGVLGLGFLVGSIVIFRKVRYRVPRLRWWQYILALIAATGILILALSSPALNSSERLPSILIGIVLLLYSLVAAAISLW